jgi:hypothetical protein
MDSSVHSIFDWNPISDQNIFTEYPETNTFGSILPILNEDKQVEQKFTYN